MTREQQIDWLCRLKSEIKIFMPYQWQKPFEEALDMAIKALEQEPRWIPTSERQPEENGNYLAFYLSGDETATLEFMMVDHCNAGGGWLHEKSGRKPYKKVIAWMPLPKAYREVEE